MGVQISVLAKVTKKQNNPIEYTVGRGTIQVLRQQRGWVGGGGQLLTCLKKINKKLSFSFTKKSEVFVFQTWCYLLEKKYIYIGDWVLMKNC